MATKKKNQKQQKTAPSGVLTSVADLEAVLAVGVVAVVTKRNSELQAACLGAGARVAVIHPDVAMRVGFGFAGHASFFVDGVFVSFCSSSNAAAMAKDLRRSQALIGRARAQSEAWCAEAAPADVDDFAAGLAGNYVCGDAPTEASTGTWRRAGRNIAIEFREDGYGVEVITRRETLLVGWTGGRALELRRPRAKGVLPRLTPDSRVDWRRA